MHGIPSFIDILISIHALREEGDGLQLPHFALPENFYPRPPRGGRLGRTVFRARNRWISIHALREEGDLRSVMWP